MPEEPDDDLVMRLVEEVLRQPLHLREDALRTTVRGNAGLMKKIREYADWHDKMGDFMLEPLSRPPAEGGLEPGQLLLERFRIVREIARGGMGIVYEARDEKLRRKIALKCAKHGFHTRLPPEVRHASEISHPHVCRIFEIHTATTTSGEIDFFTMEFLEGETLSARLARGPLAKDEVLTIGHQICAGVAEAHRNRVVHGDLKSNNVILAQDAGGGVRAVITDFGLARMPRGPVADAAVTGAAEGLGGSEAGGTPDYMAPELWKGEKPAIASDIYALGVLLYELTAAHQPWPSGTHWEDRVRIRPKALHHKWNPILQRCLDPDPARRFRDAGAVAAALEPAHWRRWAMVAAAAIVIASAVSGTITYRRATAPRESARLAMLSLDGDPDERDLAQSLSLATSNQLLLLKGGTRVKLSIVPRNQVLERRADTVAGAGSQLSATHVVHGTVTHENGKVVVHAFLTDTRSQANTGDWEGEYAPGEVRYASAAIAGMVTASLHLPPLAAPPVNVQARASYFAGLKFIRRDSTIDQAVSALAAAVAADPDSALTWAELGEAQWLRFNVTGDSALLDRATESARQARIRNPDLAAVHEVTGALRANAGFYEQAQAEYLRAIELDSSDGEPYRWLGQVYSRNNQLDLALAAFEKAAELEPGYFKVFRDLGTYYLQRGNQPEAARQYEKSVKLAPDEPDLHRRLLGAYADLGRYAESEREMRTIISLAPTPAALLGLASTLMYQGRDVEAVPFLERAVALSPSDGMIWMDLGVALRRTSRTPEARRAERKALEQTEQAMARNPRDGIIRSRLAYLSARLGDRKRAESEIAQALQLAAADSTVRETAVWTFEALDKRSESLAILRASANDVLRDSARWPDLADLHRDSRFLELLASRGVKQ